MARKDRRQTKRERKELARQRKLEEIRRAKRRQRTRRMTSLGVIVVAIGGIVFWVLQSGKAGREATERLNALAESAGCSTVQSPTIEGFTHITPPQTVSYRTVPPTSGDHYAVGAPTNTGIHATPVQNEVQVHNLEHGHVAIQYNNIPEERIAELTEVVNKDAEWRLLAPYPQMTHQVAMTAWGRMLTCDEAGEDVAAVAEEFAERFKDDGRESVPGTPRQAGAPAGNAPPGNAPPPVHGG